MSTILIIEDDDSVLLPLVDLLSMEGYDVVSAQSGEEGVAQALEVEPDLVLCDIILPGIDGFEVLKSIRAHSEFVMVPFIFLSARTEKEDTEKGLNLGADDFVYQPFEPGLLIQRIRARLEKYRAMSQSLNQVRSSLIEKVPHEFKTPLNGILGFASMMRDNALLLSPAEVRDFSSMILESGERMLQTVGNYVRYLELQIDLHQEETPAKYRLGKCSVETSLLREVLERLYSQYPQRKSDLEMFIHPADLAVQEADLVFIVQQLLDNAFKFSSANSAINLNTFIDSECYVLSVADRGKGMDESQPSIVEPFVQLNRDLDEQQGLGLGLSIISGLAKLYKGSMSITGKVGEGTRVIVRLPLFQPQHRFQGID